MEPATTVVMNDVRRRAVRTADQVTARAAANGAVGGVARRQGYADPMRLLRRALGALGLAALFAAAARLRGKGGTPPQHGGWQPIDPDGTLADEPSGAAVTAADSPPDSAAAR